MKNIPNRNQPWIHSLWADGLFILSPPLIVAACIFSFPNFFLGHNSDVPSWIWLLCVVGVDVSHVYATLFRTYLDKSSFLSHRKLYILTPLFCFLASILLYAVHPMVFWRTMAYIAVFHFIRQQYGILKLYTRFENAPNWKLCIDIITIYSITLGPILIWHFSDAKEFNWFIKDDFIFLPIPNMILIINYLIASILLCYFYSEIHSFFKAKTINIPKNILILGTFVNWYFGIVINDGDLIFTCLNIVSHGIPYIALTWFYGKKNQKNTSISFIPTFSGLSSFILLIISLAIGEEMLWDVLIWRDHPEYFSLFYFKINQWWKMFEAILVPLLSLPQITHYILDGFIWRKSFMKPFEIPTL